MNNNKQYLEKCKQCKYCKKSLFTSNFRCKLHCDYIDDKLYFPLCEMSNLDNECKDYLPNMVIKLFTYMSESFINNKAENDND